MFYVENYVSFLKQEAFIHYAKSFHKKKVSKLQHYNLNVRKIGRM
jgi:hypothetical protein